MFPDSRHEWICNQDAWFFSHLYAIHLSVGFYLLLHVSIATYAHSIFKLGIYITFPPRTLKYFTDGKLDSLKVTAQVALRAGFSEEMQR